MDLGSETPNPETNPASSWERADAQPVPEPAPLPPPLAVPVLQPPPEGSPARSSSGSLPRQEASQAASPGASEGPVPRRRPEEEQTVIIRVAPKRTIGVGKLLLTVAVAAVVAYVGIAWQRGRLLPATIEARLERLVPRRQAAATKTETPAPASAPAAESTPAAAPTTARVAEVAPLDGDDAVRAKAETPESFAAQGYAALDRQAYAEAARLFRRTLVERPSNGTAIFGLAESYRSMGFRAAALRTYRRYVEVLPKGPDAGRARAHIRALEAKKR